MKQTEKKWWSVLPLSRQLRRQYWLLSAGALAAAGLAYVSPLVQRRFIDLLSHRDELAWKYLFLTALLFGGVRLLNGTLMLFGNLWANAIGLRLKNRIAHRVLTLPYGVLKNLGGGYLAARITSDADTVQNFLARNAFSILTDAGRFAGAFLFFCCSDWRVALGTLPFVFLYFGLIRHFHRRNVRLSHELLETRASSQRTAGELFGRAALIKNRNAEREAAVQMGGRFRRQALLKAARMRLHALYQASGSLVQPLAQGTLLVTGVWFILQGKWNIGLLWAYHCYLGHLLSPVYAFCETAFQLENVRAAAERIRELTEGEKEGRGGDAAPRRLQGRIELCGLTFAYPCKPPLFDHAELTVDPGDHVVVTGLSGSGKSTLAALLTGLYRPQQGRILFDGIPLENYRLSALRRRIGFVTQEVELLRGSLRSNLLTGLPKPHPGDEELTAVLARVGISRPLGETVLENGGGWSGGEKVRIALARELLHRSDLLLLDECTASLDDENCSRILDLVETLFAGKTILSFSHDGRLVERFPRHVELLDGRFVQKEGAAR